MQQNYNLILKFWFETLQPSQWWQQNDDLDSTITTQFKTLHTAAEIGELYAWRLEPLGRLAEILILDRFGRYPHRNKILGRSSTPEELQFLETHKGF